MEFEDINKVG